LRKETHEGRKVYLLVRLRDKVGFFFLEEKEGREKRGVRGIGRNAAMERESKTRPGLLAGTRGREERIKSCRHLKGGKRKNVVFCLSRK